MRALRLFLYGVIAVMGLGFACELIFIDGKIVSAIIPAAIGFMCIPLFVQQWKTK